ncbi:Fe2+-dependent dioxygenase [Maricaulis sp. MIT060901]|uniref:Fe2+-dependent dioxygenase n=1 Tax=Maricaulis sp. MIT060901 TaxID=3096993 RepID=UPI00399B6E53
MLLQLEKVCTEAEVTTLRDLITRQDNFQDGKATAGYAARQVKDNEQLASGAEIDTVRSVVRKALEKHPLYRPFAQPRAITRMLVSRYTPGMEYGTHVDDALMGGRRTDLSFTLFLSAPDSYEGGELVIEDMGGESAIKLGPGDAVIYPTGALHRVATVTGGERLAVVGWIRSLVRRADQREILFDLELTSRAIYEKDGKSAIFDTLSKTRSNLLRMWAED